MTGRDPTRAVCRRRSTRLAQSPALCGRGRYRGALRRCSERLRAHGGAWAARRQFWLVPKGSRQNGPRAPLVSLQQRLPGQCLHAPSAVTGDHCQSPGRARSCSMSKLRLARAIATCSACREKHPVCVSTSPQPHSGWCRRAPESRSNAHLVPRKERLQVGIAKGRLPFGAGCRCIGLVAAVAGVGLLPPVLHGAHHARGGLVWAPLSFPGCSE